MTPRPLSAARAGAAILLAASLTAGGERLAAADTRQAVPPASTTTAAPPPSSTTTSSTTSTTVAPPPQPPPTAPPGGQPPGTSASPDTTAPAPPGSTTTSTGPTTTTPAPPFDPAKLIALLQGLDGDLARAQAIAAYQAARAAAAQLALGQHPQSTPDPVLIDAATTQLQATAVRAAAQDAFDRARRRINQVAVALYVGVQAPTDAGPLSGSIATRSVMLSMILDEQRGQLRAARKELKRADDRFDASRRHADDLVNARATALEVKAQSALAAPTTAVPPSTVPPSTTVPASSTAPGRRPTTTLPPAIVAMSPTVLGQPVLTADEVLGWYNASGHQPQITVPLADLLTEYQTRGSVDGVRWDVAFAQTVLETAYLGFPSYGQVSVADNNFAGIGACDSCATGSHFSDAATGVAAHLQLLHAYATTQPLAGPLPGPFWVTGCCPTWLGLTGVWATAPNYGFSILKTYRTMVAWALAHRAANAGL